MIVLDTNIISELMSNSPSANVVEWFDENNVLDLFITTVTIAEISYGLELLPNGKRKTHLEESFNKSIMIAFKHRTLFFDEDSACIYGKIMSNRKKLGQPMSIPDGQIAAIAKASNASVATRNISDFTQCGLELFNPFNYSKI